MHQNVLSSVYIHLYFLNFCTILSKADQYLYLFMALVTWYKLEAPGRGSLSWGIASIRLAVGKHVGAHSPFNAVRKFQL